MPVRKHTARCSLKYNLHLARLYEPPAASQWQKSQRKALTLFALCPFPSLSQSPGFHCTFESYRQCLRSTRAVYPNTKAGGHRLHWVERVCVGRRRDALDSEIALPWKAEGLNHTVLAQFLADELSHMPPCRRRVVTGIRISSRALSLWKPENNETEGQGWR